MKDQDRKPKTTKPPRETYNIQFVRELDTLDIADVILQYELLRARDAKKEVSLPVEMVHDIKFRLKYYEERYGEIERPERER